MDEAEPVGESLGVLTLLFRPVEGADSAVTVRFMAAWRGSAVVVLILEDFLVRKSNSDGSGVILQRAGRCGGKSIDREDFSRRDGRGEWLSNRPMR